MVFCSDLPAGYETKQASGLEDRAAAATDTDKVEALLEGRAAADLHGRHVARGSRRERG